ALWDTSREHRSLEVVQAHIMLDINRAQTVVDEPVILAGQSPQGVDRPFINRWMPTLARKLSYRHHDIRTLMDFWGSLKVNHGIENSSQHRAAADVQWSLSVARAYRDAMERNFEYLEGQNERFGLE